MAEESPLRRYTANLQGEIDSATLYRTLAETEKNPELAQVHSRLGAVEEAHAEFWKRLAASGAALFLIGAGPTLFTALGVWFSGVRQVLVGFAAAALTYGAGKLIGVAVTG